MAVFHLGWQAVQKESVPEESDFIPADTPKIRVLGAGEQGTDGVYLYDGYGNWIKTEEPICNIQRAGSSWCIKRGPAVYLYEAEDQLTGGDAENLPKTGWQIMQGTAPAPTLSIEP